MPVIDKSHSNTSEPLVSFVITTCNQPCEYLEKCIKSIVQLSLNAKEREIILIDDGSDDYPTHLLSEYSDQLLYLLLPHLGSSIARNYGLMIAQGKYVQFIEGDDYLLQAAYEHCLDIVRYHHPDIVTFGFAKSDNAAEPSYELPTPVSGTEYLNNNNILGSACSYIFRRGIVGRLQFSPSITFGEDEEFTPQLFLRAERIFNTNTSPYYNRVDKYATCQLDDKEMMASHMDSKLEVLLNLKRLLDVIPVADRQALHRRIAQLTMYYLCDNIRLKHSLIALNHEIKKLRKNGLYPLPDKDYSKTYIAFRKMIGTYVGQLALLLFIKKEKEKQSD